VLPVQTVDDLDMGRPHWMVELVERMVDQHRRLHEVRTEHEKDLLPLAAADDEIAD